MSGPPISLATAVELVAERTARLPGEQVATSEARGRVLCEDLVSAINLPPFDNSAMDGFAVRAADTAGASEAAPARLRLASESRAGAPLREAIEPNSAIRISTGAAMPQGADAVLRVEQSELDGDAVLLTRSLESGQDVRPAADDIAAGTTVLQAGSVLRSGELALAAAVGAEQLVVTRRPSIGIVATGDELVPVGSPLGPGQIHDSNSVMLEQLATAGGGAVEHLIRRVADDAKATEAAISTAAAGADVVVVCGGVSVGRHDHVKPALQTLGAEQVFWQVALRPGHPTWFGVLAREGAPPTLIFGLPGNPVSAYVTYLLFVAPALAALQGTADAPLELPARYRGASQKKRPGFAQVLRCSIALEDGEVIARLTAENQRSHAVSSLAGADALLFAEVESDSLDDGDRVTIRLLDQYT